MTSQRSEVRVLYRPPSLPRAVSRTGFYPAVVPLEEQRECCGNRRGTKRRRPGRVAATLREPRHWLKARHRQANTTREPVPEAPPAPEAHTDWPPLPGRAEPVARTCQLQPPFQESWVEPRTRLRPNERGVFLCQPVRPAPGFHDDLLPPSAPFCLCRHGHYRARHSPGHLTNRSPDTDMPPPPPRHTGAHRHGIRIPR